MMLNIDNDKKEIMTFEDTAKYLKSANPNLYKMTRKVKIPAVKSANQWRFRKEDIDKLLQEIRNKEILSNTKK